MPVRWSQIVQLAVIAAIVAAATTAVAVLIPWLPLSASEQRDGIDFTFWLATGICIFIFAVVVSRDPVLGREVPGAAGRRHRRAADPRPHGARDRVDRGAGAARHDDRHRRGRRAHAEQQRRVEPVAR